MKLKLFVIFIFIPMQLFAQLGGAIKLMDNKIIYVNKSIINFFENNKHQYSSWNEETKFKITYQKLFIKNSYIATIKNGYIAQFLKSNDDISLINTQSKYAEIDLKNKKIKYIDRWENNDNESKIKPKKIKEKVKKKIKFKSKRIGG